jgi:excisionase family DNA binding protein
MESTDQLLGDEEVAHILKVTVKTAHRLMIRRKLPVVKVGRFLRVKASDLNSYMAKLIVNNGSATAHE